MSSNWFSDLFIEEAKAAIEFRNNLGDGSSGSGGSSEDWISDGNTHIWITLPEGRTSPMLGVCPNGTVTVDWGDGTTPDVLTGTSTSTVKWTPNHDYAKPGDYVITLTVDGKMAFVGESWDGSWILSGVSKSDNLNATYRCATRRIEVGNNVIIGDYAFSSCYALGSVNITESLTSIGQSGFRSCFSLASLVFLKGLTNIATYAFGSCYGIRYLDFSACTGVPTLENKNAFTSIPADCEIRVPAALYDEWKAATNWATYASQIVAV